MVFEERLEHLRKLIKEQDKFKKDAVDLANQHLGLVHTVEEMEEIKKEADDRMKSKNQLAIENKFEDKSIEEEVEKNNWKSFEIELNVDNKNFPNTLFPFYKKHLKYNSLSINNVLHLLIYDQNENQCLLNTTHYFNSDKKEGFYILTDELKKLLCGRGSDNIEEIKKYLEILYHVNLKGKVTKYEKTLREKLPEDEKRIFIGKGVEYDDDNIFNVKEIENGEGQTKSLSSEQGSGFNTNSKNNFNGKPSTSLIHFMPDGLNPTGSSPRQIIHYLPDNPILLFIELRKLLAAKKAGHDNTYNQVNAILKRLLETNIISTEKYSKILKKHYSEDM